MLFALWGDKWNAQVKRATLVELALDPHSALVVIGDRLDDCQSQPGTLDVYGIPALNPVELFKQTMLVFRGDADPVVAYGDDKYLTVVMQTYVNLSWLRCVLDRIIHQVLDSLADERLVGHRRRCIGG